MSVSVSPYGLHRVVAPAGVLPQQADRLDPSPPAQRGEVMIDVERLNLDAASFHQIREEQEGDPDRMRARVVSIVRERGKMHNPVTGSGGMLIGTVREAPERSELKAGDRLATLVSLTLTPLVIEDVSAWDGSSEQVPIRGHAILFPSGAFARVPKDLPDRLALAVLDVAGAPAQVKRLAGGRDTTIVVGAAGKSGLLAMVAARGRSKRVTGVVHHDDDVRALGELGFDDVVVADARDAVETLTAARALGGDERGAADLVVNCVNVPGTEAASILLAREGGTVLFFSMATSFTAAALIAEGVGKDVTLLIGSGYVPGHADLALGMMRQHATLRALFERRYAS
ncbi:MAG: L-erythro-3,5-diaminohexanoate dehydrogenase [Actinomycetota bacterium]|nr:L-erythro-3,5-diaminohexanoate dehydrogenase [Actinomycetota bacterium]